MAKKRAWGSPKQVAALAYGREVRMMNIAAGMTGAGKRKCIKKKIVQVINPYTGYEYPAKRCAKYSGTRKAIKSAKKSVSPKGYPRGGLVANYRKRFNGIVQPGTPSWDSCYEKGLLYYPKTKKCGYAAKYLAKGMSANNRQNHPLSYFKNQYGHAYPLNPSTNGMNKASMLYWINKFVSKK